MPRSEVKTRRALGRSRSFRTSDTNGARLSSETKERIGNGQYGRTFACARILPSHLALDIIRMQTGSQNLELNESIHCPVPSMFDLTVVIGLTTANLEFQHRHSTLEHKSPPSDYIARHSRLQTQEDMVIHIFPPEVASSSMLPTLLSLVLCLSRSAPSRWSAASVG